MLKHNQFKVSLLGLLLATGINISVAANVINPLPPTVKCPCDFNLEEAKKIFTSVQSGTIACGRSHGGEFKDGKLISSNLAYSLISMDLSKISPETKLPEYHNWNVISETNKPDLPRYCGKSMDVAHPQKVLIKSDEENKSCLDSLQAVITSVGVVCAIKF